MTDRGRFSGLNEDGESLSDCLDRLSTQIEALRAERAHIAAVLETFRQAELSVSSVQPLLDLAEELNGVMS